MFNGIGSSNDPNHPAPYADRPRIVSLNEEVQRIAGFIEDPLVHQPTLGPNRVICLACGSRVAFRFQRFSRTEWEMHKTNCQRAQVVGRSFVAATKFDALTQEDVTFDNEEKKQRKGLFSKTIVEFRQRERHWRERQRQRQRQGTCDGNPTTSAQIVAPPSSRLAREPPYPYNHSVGSPLPVNEDKGSLFRSMKLPPPPTRYSEISSPLMVLADTAARQDYLPADGYFH